LARQNYNAIEKEGKGGRLPIEFKRISLVSAPKKGGKKKRPPPPTRTTGREENARGEKNDLLAIIRKPKGSAP